MPLKHVCIYGQECWCGAGETKTLSDGRRAHVAGVTGKAGWPMKSDGMGVHPDQREEAYNESVSLGVPTQFDEKGFAVLADPQHRLKLAKALKLHDRNCFNF